MDINIKAFEYKYNENYEWLYTCGDKLSEYRELVESFDEFLQTHSSFVCEFAKHKGDLISSDREAAAFMLTLKDFMCD